MPEVPSLFSLAVSSVKDDEKVLKVVCSQAKRKLMKNKPNELFNVESLKSQCLLLSQTSIDVIFNLTKNISFIPPPIHTVKENLIALIQYCHKTFEDDWQAFP